MANIEVVKHLILSIIDESKGIARVSLINNVVHNYSKTITPADLSVALDDLMSASIIDTDGTFYFRKK